MQVGKPFGFRRWEEGLTRLRKEYKEAGFLVLAAIRDEKRFVLDMREIERPGPSYTIETLRELRATLGADVPLVLIMGSDQFERLATWRDWRLLLDLAHLAVARRADAVLRPSYVLQEYFNAHWAPE